MILLASYIAICTCILTGQPVGWCLSDHESSDIIETFLSSIKARSPLIQVTVMMTDDGTDSILIQHIIQN